MLCIDIDVVTPQINIRFNDTLSETFEYPNEEHALELYLAEHPHDTEDIVFLDNFGGGGESDDMESVDVIETPSTPRGNSDDDLLRSNPSLSSTGKNCQPAYK